MIVRAFLAGLLSLAPVLAAEPALTIYNQNFAVVRETIPLDLKQGATSVRFTDTTAYLEPQSVILRDPTGQRAIRILEQNFRADPVSPETLLRLYEGKTVEFLVRYQDKTEIVTGKIIRAGTLNPQPRYNVGPYPSRAPDQPIIEVGGKLRFDLPGTPLFPALADGTILKPALDWLIESNRPGRLNAELCYVTGEMSWSADYNVVAPETGSDLDVIGWVSMVNQSGRVFDNARIKLMAGDVNKVEPGQPERFGMATARSGGVMGGIAGAPPVTEKTFDEYHLYTLQRPTTLHDKETKQVEFIRAAGVKAEVIYVYDGAKFDTNRYRGWGQEMIRQDAMYGTQSNPKVWVMREFVNSEANHLGMPLPRGRVRFYRRDTGGRLEFTGEDTIEHTPRDETVRLFTGASFDVTGERRRTNFRIDQQRSVLDEAFEIKVRNHKSEAVEVRVVEHLYRWSTWELQVNSAPYAKKDSQTVEFKVPLAPGEEKVLTYSVHYTW